MKGILTGIILCCALQASAQNLYDVPHTLRYAEHLYAGKKYTAAETEYKRLLKYYPANDTFVRKLLSIWKLQGRYDSAVRFIRASYPDLQKQPEFLSAEYIKCSILAGRYAAADSLLNQDLITLHPVLQIDTAKVARYRFYSFFLEGKYHNITPFEKEQALAYTANRHAWSALIYKQENTRHKSAPAAMAMSAVLPGAGKIYAGDWKDGILSMLTIASMGYESYVGFQARGTKSVLGWVFGGLALGFYSGNIYGSYHSAIRYNNRLDNEIHDKAKELTAADL